MRCGIIADSGEFEHRMPVCLGNEGGDRSVDRRSEVRSRGAGDPDIALEDWSGLLRRHLPHRVRPPRTAAAQLNLPGASGVMHP